MRAGMQRIDWIRFKALVAWMALLVLSGCTRNYYDRDYERPSGGSCCRGAMPDGDPEDWATEALGQDPTQVPVTNITVPDMHCMSCAREMADNLSKVPGVAAVRANVPAKTTMVTPQPQQIPSPRALWEAIANAGYHPSRLEGPSGTFVSKPKS